MIAFILAYLLTWPALVIILALGVICEARESHAWAIFMGIVGAMVAFFFFDISLQLLAIGFVAYMIVGFVWSFWRYKRFVDKRVADGRWEYHHSTNKAFKESLLPTKNLDKITTWIIVWPFSMVENVIGDFINLVHTAITTYFKSVYIRIYDSAISKIPD